MCTSPQQVAQDICFSSSLHQLNPRCEILGIERASSPQTSRMRHKSVCRRWFVRIFPPYVAQHDLAVHSTRAAWVDGRGDVYRWSDWFFVQESASGDRYMNVAGPGEGAVPVSLLRCQQSQVDFRSLFLSNGIPTYCYIWHVCDNSGSLAGTLC